MATPEGILKADIVATLKQLGVFYLRIQSGRVRVKGGFMHLAPEGTADFLVCNSHPLWIELKAPGQKTLKSRQDAQGAFRDRVLALGHRHAQVTSVDELMVALRS